MVKKRAFVSYDIEHDEELRAFIVSQSENPDSPFIVVGSSPREASQGKDSDEKTEKTIKYSDVFIVMVGPGTHKSAGVAKEVALARKWCIPIMQIIGYRGGNFEPVLDARELQIWDWENIKKLLS
jgi:hypothetical protein